MTQPSYAVIWREGGGPVRPGKLVLGPASLALETGAPGGRLTSWILRYADLASVEKAAGEQRIHNRPTAVLRRRNRDPLAIAALEGLGFGHEIVERLAGVIPGPS
jgi:hypothetical protein